MLAAGGGLLSLLLAKPSRVVAVEASGLIAFVALCWWAAKEGGVINRLSRLRDSEKLLLVLIACLACAFAGWYLGQYHFHPIWDQKLYYTRVLDFDASLTSSVHRTAAEVYRSVNEQDYNNLLTWVLSLPVRIMPTWQGMFFCVFVLFQVPLSLVTACFVDGLFCREADRGQNCSPVCLRPYGAPVLTHSLRRAIGCPRRPAPGACCLLPS